MTTKYAFLAIALLLLRLLTLFELEAGPTFSASRSAEALRFNLDPETQLTMQQRIPFSQTGVYELELIPRISDTLAFAIVDRHEQIVRRASMLSPLKQGSAFEIVHGVGPKTAAKIADYVDIGR